MKFVRFISAAHTDGAYGLLQDDGAIEVIRGGLLDPVEKTGEVVMEKDIIRYLPPTQPPNIICIGFNYNDHAAETSFDLPTEPRIFLKPTTAAIVHGDKIVLPAMAPNQVDYEAELCVIIGRLARNVSVDQSLDYVLGYTCGIDVSARDCQFGDGQWSRGKGFDTFAPLGPCVVTDLDTSDLRVRLRLNGNAMQDESTDKMIFKVADIVSYVSRCMTLLPGTVIMTGTPSGVGYTRKPPVFLHPGDVCEVEIEGIGTLRSTVAASVEGVRS